MTIQVQPLTSNVGASMSGVDLREPLTSDAKLAIAKPSSTAVVGSGIG